MDQGRFERAIQLRDRGYTNDAIVEFQQMAKETSDRNEKSSLMLNEARCYSTLGRIRDADGLLMEIRKLAPDDRVVCANVDFGVACVAAQAGQHERALGEYDGLLRKYVDLLTKPEYRDFYADVEQRRAMSLVTLGRYAEALPALQQASGFSGLSSNDRRCIYLNMGICHQELGDTSSARDEFLRVIQFGVSDDLEDQARYRIALLYFSLGALAQAKQHLEQVLQNTPPVLSSVPRKFVYAQLSTICDSLGERETARKYQKMADKESH